MTEDGNPMPYSPVPPGPPGKQDAELKAIYSLKLGAADSHKLKEKTREGAK